MLRAYSYCTPTANEWERLPLAFKGVTMRPSDSIHCLPMPCHRGVGSAMRSQ